MVARPLQREQPDDDQEKGEMNGCFQKAARKKGVVGNSGHNVNQGEESGPAFRKRKLAPGKKLVSAETQRQSYQKERRQIGPACGCQGAEAADYKQIQRQIEVALDGFGGGGPARVDGRVSHDKSLLLAKPAQKGSVAGNRMNRSVSEQLQTPSAGNAGQSYFSWVSAAAFRHGMSETRSRDDPCGCDAKSRPRH